MQKPAETQFPIHPLLQNRWSPRAFSEKTLSDDTLRLLLEAARWAASCFNEQPWSFLVATKQEEADHQTMLSCLAETNQVWAKQAPVLMISVAKMRFDHNGQPNRHAYHDVGLAVANLVIQATALDLGVHQMAGIVPERIQSEYQIPEHYEAVTALAIGYFGDPNTLPDNLAEREQANRTRNPFTDFVFTNQWGQSPKFIQ